jgi:hypothetical protein
MVAGKVRKTTMMRMLKKMGKRKGREECGESEECEERGKSEEKRRGKMRVR